MNPVQNNPMTLLGMNFIAPTNSLVVQKPPAQNMPAQNFHPIKQENPLLNPLDSLRRRLPAEINAISQQLMSSGLKDGKSLEIATWRDNFRAALNIMVKNKNPQMILDQFIHLMQMILEEQDENSVLGSDGFAYGKMNLAIKLNMFSPLYRKRSPSKPNDPTPLTTNAHPNVRYMIDWLKKHHSWHPNKEIKEQYEQLEKQDSVPQISVEPISSNPLLERLQRIRIAAAQIAAEESQKKVLQEQQYKAQINFYVGCYVQNVQAISNLSDGNLAHQNDQLDNAQQNFDNRINELNNQSQQLENDIAHLEQQNQQLNQDLAQLQGNISQAQKEEIQLQILINETKKEIKKNKNKWIKDVVIAAGIVGACLFAQWALQAIASAAGTGAKAILTTKGTGLGFKVLQPLG